MCVCFGEGGWVSLILQCRWVCVSLKGGSANPWLQSTGWIGRLTTGPGRSSRLLNNSDEKVVPELSLWQWGRRNVNVWKTSGVWLDRTWNYLGKWGWVSCGGEDRGFNFGQVECYLPVGYLRGDLNWSTKGIICSGNRYLGVIHTLVISEAMWIEVTGGKCLTEVRQDWMMKP